ncbi:unnamed protein product [Effrenium voratum]|uniref:Uncharacterized protein n=1 Tax=Effrenium voratum TaxID=2562239 RepID=A0AA36N8Z6_9DINO|nr:unnamed protein product [Effrenium voratum]CAJ1403445.1 unnamed protein product [Effrenium voratum]
MAAFDRYMAFRNFDGPSGLALGLEEIDRKSSGSWMQRQLSKLKSSSSSDSSSKSKKAKKKAKKEKKKLKKEKKKLKKQQKKSADKGDASSSKELQHDAQTNDKGMSGFRMQAERNALSVPTVLGLSVFSVACFGHRTF